MSFETIIPLIMVAGSAISAVGDIQEGNARGDQYDAERDAAYFQAKGFENQAVAERDAAETEASDFRRRQSRILAERRAGIGATGLRNTGSVKLVEEATVREAALGSARLGQRGVVQGQQLEDEASLARQRGKYSGQAADAARASGWMNAGSTLLTGLGGAGRVAWGL